MTKLKNEVTSLESKKTSRRKFFKAAAATGAVAATALAATTTIASATNIARNDTNIRRFRSSHPSYNY